VVRTGSGAFAVTRQVSHRVPIGHRADWGNQQVVKLAAGSSTQTVLPFTGLDVAVEAAGTVYVTDGGNNRVLKLPAGFSWAQFGHSYS
jgi:DNA-binding beta-propeller fold protein YncE